MSHPFQVRALAAEQFSSLFQHTDQELQHLNIHRVIADKNPGFPCRVSLQDAEIGEELLLLHYPHHHVDSPYRASGPVFVRKNAQNVQLSRNELPKHLNHRFLSLRAYNVEGLLLNASHFQGENLESEIQKMFDDDAIQYLHIHNAAQGCFHCQVDRVE